MAWLVLALSGGHSITVEVLPDDGERLLALVTRGMDADGLGGHLEVRPREHTVTRIRLMDIVLAELSDEKPSGGERA